MKISPKETFFVFFVFRLNSLMAYKIFIEPDAFEDIQNGINWYNEKSDGLGNKFHSVINSCFEDIKSNPYY